MNEATTRKSSPTEALQGRALVSALADGQLQGDELDRALGLLHTDADAQAAWDSFHQVGDLLRSADAALEPAGSVRFTAAVMARLAVEPALTASSRSRLPLHRDARVAPAQTRAANDAWGWKMVAGLAGVAAVSALAWNMWVPVPTQAVLAVAAPPATLSAGAASAVPLADPVMIRDARLDELLAAHRQFGGTSALQAPAGFLRNATFEAPQR